MLPAIYYVLLTLTIWSDTRTAAVTNPTIFSSKEQCHEQAVIQHRHALAELHKGQYPTAWYYWYVPSKNLEEL